METLVLDRKMPPDTLFSFMGVDRIMAIKQGSAALLTPGAADEARRETVPANSKKWVNPLLGLGKTIGTKLTLDRFMELQQEEVELENENDKRLWGNK